MAKATVRPPEPEPPHGTDSDDYRAWAYLHADDATFRALYATRAEKIRHKHQLGIRHSAEAFLARLSRLCP